MHEAIEQDERLDFDALFNNKRNNLFALKVSGDSMIDAHIDDGDYVIIRNQHNALPGQIVVAQTPMARRRSNGSIPRKVQKAHSLAARQFVDEADLRERLPHFGRRFRRGAEGRLNASF